MPPIIVVRRLHEGERRDIRRLAAEHGLGLRPLQGEKRAVVAAGNSSTPAGSRAAMWA